jgi:hypothetical protein
MNWTNVDEQSLERLREWAMWWAKKPAPWCTVPPTVFEWAVEKILELRAEVQVFGPWPRVETTGNPPEGNDDANEPE